MNEKMIILETLCFSLTRSLVPLKTVFSISSFVQLVRDQHSLLTALFSFTNTERLEFLQENQTPKLLLEQDQ